TQVIVDFGDGANGRTRRARRRLLLDGDRRRKPLDGVHFGPLHLIEELPGVGGKRLDVAPLALGIDGVKRQRSEERRVGKEGGNGGQLKATNYNDGGCYVAENNNKRSHSVRGR